MPKYYIIPRLGDVVYTDQIKHDRGLDIQTKSVEFYLKGIQQAPKYPRQKFKLIGKITQPIEPKQPKIKGREFGPQFPTPIQAKRNAERITFEKKMERERKLRRLSRRNGWEFIEVSAIAASAFIKGIQSVMTIPEEQWDEKVKQAMKVARESINDWQEYELTHD